MSRDPFDGQPFYCDTCGFSFAEEQGQCESSALCRLETKAAAENRQRRRRPLTTAAQPGEQT